MTVSYRGYIFMCFILIKRKVCVVYFKLDLIFLIYGLNVLYLGKIDDYSVDKMRIVRIF